MCIRDRVLPELKTGAPKECLVYHLARYIVRKPSRITDCGDCAVTLRNDRPPNLPAAVWTKIKDYGTIEETSHLTHPSNGVYHVLLQAETTVTIKLSSPNSMWAVSYTHLDVYKRQV